MDAALNHWAMVEHSVSRGSSTYALQHLCIHAWHARHLIHSCNPPDSVCVAHKHTGALASLRIPPPVTMVATITTTTQRTMPTLLQWQRICGISPLRTSHNMMAYAVTPPVFRYIKLRVGYTPCTHRGGVHRAVWSAEPVNSSPLCDTGEHQCGLDHTNAGVNGSPCRECGGMPIPCGACTARHVTQSRCPAEDQVEDQAYASSMA